MDIDPGLIRKYNRPGPRYTSYPTAPQFDASFGPEEFARDIRTRGGGDLSLYTHLPFCHSLCYYCGCHMMVTHRPEKVATYLEYLEREMDLLAAHVGPGRAVRQVHWGGGTPSYLSPEQVEALMASLRVRFGVTDDAEISIEVDPRRLTVAHLEAARRSGFNRVSIGVQDFDPVVQEAIGRVQPEALVREAVETCRRLEFESVSFDLIYGLPHQTIRTFAATLDRVIELGPDRISLFSYAHVPWLKKHQNLLPTEHLPAPEDKLRIFTTAVARLTGEGDYRHIGMDHFARPDDSLCAALDAGTLQRNFQGYSTHGGSELLALGISGISQLDGSYAQNARELPDYYRALDAGRLPVERGLRLTFDDRVRRHAIGSLMSHFVLHPRELESRFGIRFETYFADIFDELGVLEKDGLVRVADDRIEVTPLGRFFVRNVAMLFDAYLASSSRPQGQAYSQTV
jgi:oxygen-independent coproporphyrinogen III oxidase